jgi:hypothetical protein
VRLLRNKKHTKERTVELNIIAITIIWYRAAIGGAIPESI